MSEWQKNLEARAKHTTAMYILENSSGNAAGRSDARHRRAEDMTFGLFCIMMGIAMCILAAGLILTAESNLFSSAGFVTAYVLMGVTLLVRGIAGLMK